MTNNDDFGQTSLNVPQNILASDLDGDVDSLSLKEQERKRYIQDTQYRKYLSWWMMIIVPSWLFITIVVLVLCGLSVLRLDGTVLCALLTTTMGNVLGLAYIVLRGKFPIPFKGKV